MKRLSIGIYGTRGIPANYGGFETFAEELSKRLVARGHLITVSCRSHNYSQKQAFYQGIALEYAPAIRSKHFETPSHSALAFLKTYRSKFDLILVCNAANSPFLPILKFKKIPSVVNVDGIERKRKKWGIFGQSWYYLSEYATKFFADEIIADAEIIKEYWLTTHNRKSSVITYGYRKNHEEKVIQKLAQKEFIWSNNLTEKFKANSYILYCSRLEPENNCEIVLKAYLSLPRDIQVAFPLVVIGDAPYALEYKKKLFELASVCEDIHFLGFKFGIEYEQLQLGALIYVQATEVGGTHPALVEAMGYANSIIANDVPEHREVLGDAGFYYEFNSTKDLAQNILRQLQNKDLINEMRQKARTRAEKLYDWEKITDQYERLFEQLLQKNKD